MPTLFNQFVEQYTQISNANSFRRIYEASWNGIKRNDEVEAIRSYLIDANVGISYLNDKVAPALSKGPFNVKFASIFCHKKPTIQRTQSSVTRNKGDTPGCELGDLFVLFVLCDGQDNLHYSAGALFQAKRFAKLDSESQRCLYDCDADFEVPKHLEMHTPSLGKYRLMPTYDEGRANGVRYLILSPSLNVTDIQARHSPWSNNHQRRWSTFMDGLLSGSDGLRTGLASSPPSSWDVIVEDLLRVGLSAQFKKKSPKPPRGNTVAVQVATSLFNNFTNLKDSVAIVEGEDDFGVPTLMIIAHAPDYKTS